MADDVQQFGRTELLIATYMPAPATNLEKLGEALDMIDLSEQVFFHNVPGDRLGGPQGPPIDVQFLGEIVTITLDLSRWDPAIFASLRGHRIHSPALGSIDLCTIGQFMLVNRSWRVALKSWKIDPADGQCKAYGLNFVCCIVRTPIGHNRGTKYSALSFQFEAHMAPEGHPKAGIIWDEDLTDPQ